MTTCVKTWSQALLKAKENKPEEYDLTEQDTTFVQDFLIAVRFGSGAIYDTYNRAREEWLPDPVYWTACVMAINQLSWHFYETGKMKLCEIFSDLYHQADNDFYDFYDSQSQSDRDARLYYYHMTD